MDRNAFLAFALSFLVLTLWMMWEAERRPPPKPPPPAAEAPPLAEAAPPTPAPAPAPLPVARAEAAAPEQNVPVETDLIRAELTSRGAALSRWELRRYFVTPKPNSPPVELTTHDPSRAVALATPLEELGLGDLSRAAFSVTAQEPQRVAFEYADAGITVRKTYHFEADSYAFRLRLELVNGSGRTLEPRFDAVWPSRARPGSDFADMSLTALHDGELVTTRLDGFGKGGFTTSLTGGSPETERVMPGGVAWAGMQTRYFLAVMLPDVPQDAEARFDVLEPGRSGLTSVSTRAFAIPPGTTVAREYRVYLGPKEPTRLAVIGASLERSIDLGWSWVAPLTRGFNWLLRACYSVIPNYGMAIILITVLVRLVTAPLAAKQMRSMKRLGQLQPRIKELQEKHRDDRQRQSQEMMKLYRETGVNPLGGCFPMLLQIPVFIALYYALQSSIDLRQAPFVAWIQDLSKPETLFTVPGLELPVRLLPVLMGASMVFQQKLTPTTMDPAQARMLTVMMPIMFTVLFYTFPSGLVLYWLVSNLLAIGQQLLTNRSLERAAS